MFALLEYSLEIFTAFQPPFKHNSCRSAYDQEGLHYSMKLLESISCYFAYILD